ncbi:hypothetical protein HOD75_04565 [archaeon]|jgi:hypothetical protein|nr:hypothetical protein [archaeon]MBT4242138.1 hypothetical protein [archaeon]MBT4417826.1 hypothetical protein [archaeon]
MAIITNMDDFIFAIIFVILMFIWLTYGGLIRFALWSKLNEIENNNISLKYFIDFQIFEIFKEPFITLGIIKVPNDKKIKKLLEKLRVWYLITIIVIIILFVLAN